MKKFYALALASLMASPVLADESFGGLGITIIPARDGGVRVVEVIKGTPAEEAGIEANDQIFAVDGIKLADKSFDGAKDALRGTVGKPLEVSMVRGVDTLSITLRRGHIRLKDVSKESLENWYGDEMESYSEEEMAVVAEQGASSNQKLVAVLEHGRSIKDKSRGNDVKAIFVETEPVFEQKAGKTDKAAPKGSAKLKGLSRTTIAFEAVAGNVRIVITDANGKVFENKLVSANGGANFVPWNGESVPAGRYSVSLEQNGVSTKVVKVK